MGVGDREAISDQIVAIRQMAVEPLQAAGDVLQRDRPVVGGVVFLKSGMNPPLCRSDR